MWSQNDEEPVILRELTDLPTGRLLDIGAHDGRSNSNTFALIELGWGGVLVEPSPGPFTSLLARHGENPRLTLVNAAIAPEPGFRPFHDSMGDQVSTLSDKHRDFWSHAVPAWNSFLVSAVSPLQLFAGVGMRFDFVNIDVEGMNHEIAAAMPWAALVANGLRLTCIEHEGLPDRLDQLLGPHGFKRVHLTSENAIHGVTRKL